MPEVQTELEFGSEFQLLVAVMLSAQCTDKRINQVTPELFRRFPDAKSMAQVEADEVLEYIKSVSYPNAKADHLVKMARIVVERFGGEIPHDMDQLLTLPGVGRKTANVVQSVAFGKATLAVDTLVNQYTERQRDVVIRVFEDNFAPTIYEDVESVAQRNLSCSICDI